MLTFIAFVQLQITVLCQNIRGMNRQSRASCRFPGPYLGFFVCGGKLGFREISDQYSYKKQPSKIRHYVRKKTFSFPGGGNCPLRPPAMYGPGSIPTWARVVNGDNMMHVNEIRGTVIKKLIVDLAIQV